jgi:hypothetical protein
MKTWNFVSITLDNFKNAHSFLKMSLTNLEIRRNFTHNCLINLQDAKVYYVSKVKFESNSCIWIQYRTTLNTVCLFIKKIFQIILDVG